MISNDPRGTAIPKQLNGEDATHVAPDAELAPDGPSSEASPILSAIFTEENSDKKLEPALQRPAEAGFAPPPPVNTAHAILPVIDVRDLDWSALRDRIDIGGVRSRIAGIVSNMESLLNQPTGIGMLFDSDRSCPSDKAIRVTQVDGSALWIIGDLHGDLLALEAALLLIRSHVQHGAANSRIIFLGDLFDDEGFGLEVLLRVFELVLENPALVCIMAGNHDEALGYDGTQFTSSVWPSDFSDFLNSSAGDEWITRAGKLAISFFALAPRALFFPDGLFVAHGGFPLVDLHPQLQNTGEWNDPACLSDFVWTRAHPTARKKLPNRFSRGGQFGFEDFDAFCSLAGSLGRPVSHMVRGHDHVEQRFAVYPAYRAHPILTTVALSRRLSREFLGPFERAPTVARFVEGGLPQIFRLQVPAGLIAEIYPEPLDGGDTQLESAPGVA